MREVVVVPTFGGGLNVSANPVYLDPSEWLWSNGFWPNRGTAEVMRSFDVLHAGGWMPTDHIALGIVAETFRGDTGYLLGVTRHNSTSTDTGLVLIDSSGTATALASTGTEPDVTDTAAGASGMAVVNGLGYIALGSAATSSLLQYTPAAAATSSTFTRVNPSGGMEAYFCAAAGSRVWLAQAGTTAASSFLVSRQVRYSDVLDGTTWVAAISNSADSVTLDSATQLSGLAPMTGGMVVTSHDSTYVFRATGSIPAYTVETITGYGSDWQPVATPLGVVLTSDGRARLLGNAVMSDRLGSLLRNAPSLSQALWHPRYDAVIYPVGVGAAATEIAFYYLDPTTGMAWRATLPDSATPLGNSSGNHALARLAGAWIHAVVTADNETAAIYTESQTATAAYSGAYVCSKLFSFGAPPMYGRVHRIKVDVEPLSNATTDSIKVSTVALDHLSSGVLGSVDLDMDGFTYTDVPNGTLTGGLSEIPCDVVGKYVGFKFTQVSGKSRIRGFSFEWSPAGDRIP